MLFRTLALLVLLTLSVVAQQQRSPQLMSIYLQVTEVTGPAEVSGRVLLDAPAPPGFTLQASCGGPASVGPVNLYGNEGTFTVFVAEVSSRQEVYVNVSGGGQMRQATLIVSPQPKVAAIALPAAAYGGEKVKVTVRLDNVASGQGCTVVLEPGGPVTIPRGSLEATQSLTLPRPERDEDLTVAVRRQPVSARIKIFAPPQVSSFKLLTPKPVAEEVLEAELKLSRPAPLAAEIGLLPGHPLTGPKTVKVPAGKDTATVAINATSIPKRVMANVRSTVYGKEGPSLQFYLDPSPALYALESVAFRTQGAFQLDDPLAPGKRWTLKLDKAPKATRVTPTQYRVEASFSGTLGDDPAVHKVVVGFDCRGKDQEWKIEQVRIISVNGNPRT